MIYLDHASTTPTDKQVIKAMAPFWDKNFGNPSSLYKLGREASYAINNARKKVATILNVEAKEIIFTAGGTESDNLAIFGVANQFLSQASKYHLITTNIEHPAILNSFKFLEKQGFKVTYLPVDKYGIVSVDLLMKALQPNTILISIMYANNEIGTIQSIAKMAKVIKNYHHIQQVDKISSSPRYPIFHTDACQAAGYLDLDIEKLGVDLMTVNGSKIYGPKQTAILYKNKNISLFPLFYGGGQELNLRSGTENVAGIVGLATALELVAKNRGKESKRLEKLRDYFIKNLLQFEETMLNGHPTKRLPNNVNVTFRRVEGESIMLKLDALGIYVSTGSACHSVSLDPSHVILAIGQDPGDSHGSMRFTLGRTTTKKDIDKVLEVLPKIIDDLKKITAVTN